MVLAEADTDKVELAIETALADIIPDTAEFATIDKLYEQVADHIELIPVAADNVAEAAYAVNIVAHAELAVPNAVNAIAAAASEAAAINATLT